MNCQMKNCIHFGPTLEVTFSKYFPEDQVQSIIDCYQAINKSLHKDLLKEIPHAKEMLEGLKRKIYNVLLFQTNVLKW